MKKRKIGALEVSALGMGCMNLSSGTGAGVPVEEGIRTIRAAYERGITLFDTAEAYGPFINEELVGEAIKPFRNDIFDPKTDLRASFPRFSKENMEANMPLIFMLNGMAERKGVSTVQIALAWLLAQKSFIVPIPGMDKVEYIEDNIKSLDFELTAADLKEIDIILSKVEIKGERLSQVLLDDIHEKID